MQSLRQAVTQYQALGKAIGHFNVSTLEVVWAIVEAAQDLSQPVIIGVSEGERDFIGEAQLKALIDSIVSSIGHPIYLNGDHTYSFDRVKRLIDLGYDSVIVDGSSMPMAENIALTSQCVDYARQSTKDILIEGELGYIGKSSELLDAIPQAAQITPETMTKPAEAAAFVSQTKCDMLAPAVGNIHGMLKNAPNPNLDCPLVAKLSAATKIPLVLHGGSGISPADFTQSIKNGMAIVHINTEIRKAWRDEVARHLTEKPNDVAPYKILKNSKSAVKAIVSEKLRLFSHL